MNLKGILDANKLIEPNFLEWHRNTKIVFRYEKIYYLLEQPLSEIPTEDSTCEEMVTYNKHNYGNNIVICMMLAAMLSHLQKQHEGMDTNSMIFHIKELNDE